MLLIAYTFTLPDRDSISHEVWLDPATGESPPGDGVEYPSWTDLQFHQCDNCPLSAKETRRCPAAEKIAPLSGLANMLTSYDQLDVEIITPERKIVQRTTAQRAMSALIGLVMATSACPQLAYFRPMARFHLPLASEEETAYRAVSMYLSAQYFMHQRGAAPDLSLQGLMKIYEELQRVNRAFAARLRAASDKDVALNALVLLDMFAKGVPYTIAESLFDLKGLFSAYLPGSRSEL